MPVTISIDLKSSRALIGAVIVIIGGLITMVGSVLPWFEIAQVGSIGGLDTDGVITLVVGVLVVILGAVACWLVASQVDKWVPWTTGALLCLTLAGFAVTAGRIIASYSSFKHDAGLLDESVSFASFGAGISITLGGSIIAAGGGAFAFVGARKAQASDPNGTATWIGGAVALWIGGAVGLSMAIAVLDAPRLPGRGPSDAVGTAAAGAESSVPSDAVGAAAGGGESSVPSEPFTDADPDTFQSPTGNIRCKWTTGAENRAVTCDVRNLGKSAVLQGFRTAPALVLVNDFAQGLSAGPVLPYGQALEREDISCASALTQDAMRCTDLRNGGTGMALNSDGITKIG